MKVQAVKKITFHGKIYEPGEEFETEAVEIKDYLSGGYVISEEQEEIEDERPADLEEEQEEIEAPKKLVRKYVRKAKK